MSHATLQRPPAIDPAVGLARGLTDTAARLTEAVDEFDAALAAGRPMFMLVRLDREVTAAERRHRAALVASCS